MDGVEPRGVGATRFVLVGVFVCSVASSRRVYILKYILIRFVNPRLSWPACRTCLASARASPAGMTPEAPWQPLPDDA